MKKQHEPAIMPLFINPVLRVKFDLDLEKLVDFSRYHQNKDKDGVVKSNIGGWQSQDISFDRSEEFVKLKEGITENLQIYHEQVFSDMEFTNKVNPKMDLSNIWINVNEQYHYNDWHMHPMCTLSGVFYIKHDGTQENGSLSFKHPASNGGLTEQHWPPNSLKITNSVSSEVINLLPEANVLIIFPAWLTHKVEMNKKSDTRISISFNSSHERI